MQLKSCYIIICCSGTYIKRVSNSSTGSSIQYRLQCSYVSLKRQCNKEWTYFPPKEKARNISFLKLWKMSLPLYLVVWQCDKTSSNKRILYFEPSLCQHAAPMRVDKSLPCCLLNNLINCTLYSHKYNTALPKYVL